MTINGQPASLSQVRRLETATTLAIDGAPASKVAVRVAAALAARLANKPGGAG